MPIGELSDLVDLNAVYEGCAKIKNGTKGFPDVR